MIISVCKCHNLDHYCVLEDTYYYLIFAVTLKLDILFDSSLMVFVSLMVILKKEQFLDLLRAFKYVDWIRNLKVMCLVVMHLVVNRIQFHLHLFLYLFLVLDHNLLDIVDFFQIDDSPSIIIPSKSVLWLSITWTKSILWLSVITLSTIFILLTIWSKLLHFIVCVLEFAIYCISATFTKSTFSITFN